MTKYLFHNRHVGQLITLDVGRASSITFKELAIEFLHDQGLDTDQWYLINIDRIDKNESIIVNGKAIYYTWGLAGPGGAWFRLFQMPGITKEDIRIAKQKLRHSQDVVCFYDTRIDTLLPERTV